MAPATKYEFPLEMFRWRPSQRRLATEDRSIAQHDEFFVKGKHFTIKFVGTIGSVIDPHTRTGKLSRLYTPCAKTTPDEFRDLKLYVHV